MSIFRRMSGYVCFLMVAVLVFWQFPIGVAKASMISTEQVLESSAVQKDRQRVHSFMARKNVREKLTAFGVDPKEAVARVNALSDWEVRAIADRIDTLPAGQGDIGTIAVVVLIIFLVLLLTDMVGATNVFPFVRKVR